jgi:hypothetical protein
MNRFSRRLAVAVLAGSCVVGWAQAPKPAGDKEVKTAERVECVILTVGQTYRVQSKGKKAISDVFVRNADAVQAQPDAKDATQLILTPKKAGVYGVRIVPTSGKKDTEDLTVVVVEPEKK